MDAKVILEAFQDIQQPPPPPLQPGVLERRGLRPRNPLTNGAWQRGRWPDPPCIKEGTQLTTEYHYGRYQQFQWTHTDTATPTGWRCRVCNRDTRNRNRYTHSRRCAATWDANVRSILQEWRTLRDATRQAIGACQACGATNKRTEKGRSTLEVDHIEPVIEAPWREFDETNLQVLCQKCHAQRRRPLRHH